ncbi:MAG: hypothetical protein HZA89_00275 [Verrucomicrobia bacterium]|nr:hypothetical protein [Verrucomicrobiota bacterium]
MKSSNCVVLNRHGSPAWAVAVCFTILLQAVVAPPAFAVELLRNGSFSNNLAGWKVSEKVGDWSPLESGAVSLHPSGFGYTGLVLYQNLNVSGVAGQTLSLSLQLQKQSAPAGKTVNVSVDYLATNAVVKRVKVFNPTNDDVPAFSYTNFTANFTLPADAAKLVRLVVLKDGSGDFLADDFSLTATGVTTNAVPQIAALAPASGPFSSGTNTTLVTLRGQNFGSVTGQVWLSAVPVEGVGTDIPGGLAEVVSWGNTQVVARIVEPLRSGKVNLFVDGVESDGDFIFTVSGPTFTVDAVTSDITAVRGQTVDVIVRVDFLNGFQSTNGVSFLLVNPNGTGTSGDQPLKSSGGYSFRLDTSSLTNGTYQGMVQSIEEHSYARFATFNLKVVGITNINFFVYDTNFQKVSISSKTVTKQGEAPTSFELIDSDGNIFGSSGFGPPSTSPATIVSDDPARLFVYQDKFFPRFFAVANGAVNLTFTTPDGFSRALPVTVNFPSPPQVTAANYLQSTVDNSGTFTNTLFFQATGPVTWIGYEGFLGINFDYLTRDNFNNTATWAFNVPAGTQPGQYLLYGSTGDPATATLYSVLTVVNAATRGQVAGRFQVVDNPNPFLQDIFGTLELYDAGQNLVATNHLENYGTTAYSAWYLPPGSFRLRFVPDATFAPLWYPNATNFADATPVQVQAGQITSNINFFLAPAATTPTNVTPSFPVFSAGRFDVKVPTVRGVEYFLEYKNVLTDANWSVAQFLSGDAGTRTLADPAATNSVRFYRLRAQAR